MTDVTELMSRDPLLCTKDDIAGIVKEFRASRKQFNIGNMKAGSTKPLTEKQKAQKDLLGKLDLGGLKL